MIDLWPSWAQKFMVEYGKNTLGRDFFGNIFAITVDGTIDVQIGDYITIDSSNELGVVTETILKKDYIKGDETLKLPRKFHPDHDLHIIPNEDGGCDSGDCSSCDSTLLNDDDDDTGFSWYRFYKSQ